MPEFTLDAWYVFPVSVAFALVANASGFSGAVLFQPFFNFVLQMPLAQSIATGIATETIGMSSGAARYAAMRQVDGRAVRLLAPAILLGAAAGLLFFARAPREPLRLTVGLVVGGIALYQLILVGGGRYGSLAQADLAGLRRHRWRAFCSGAFSACTGTGVAELNQPLLEHQGDLATKRANATAIAVEAVADWGITAVNLSLGNLRWDILVFSASGVLIGAQFGALLSPRVPDALLKSVFALCVLGIACVYVVTALERLLAGT